MVTVSISPKSLSEFNAQLTRVATEIGMDAQSMVAKQAMLVCADMATFTPGMPKGGGQGLTKYAKFAGEDAVAGDIRKLFIAVGDRNISSQKAIVFRSLAHATQSNNRGMFDSIIKRSRIETLRISPIMTKILNDQNYDRAFLKAKNYLARVPLKTNEYGFEYAKDLRSHHNRVKAKFGGRIQRGQKIGEPRLLVESKQELDDYIKERQAAVGRTKAGWLRALNMIPKPIRANVASGNFGAKLRNAGWIARHGGQGQAISSYTDKNAQVTIQNFIGNINEIAAKADTMSLALGNRVMQMEADLNKYIARTKQKMGL
ncbi:MAG: hypothetical protein WCL05_06280 [Verrucomicrobiota bacterium]